MEVLVEVILEFLLPLFGELFAELGADLLFRGIASNRRWWRFLLYSLIGAGIGGLSLLVFRGHLINPASLRVTALAVNPVLIGLLMTRLGRWREKRAGAAFGLEAFWPAWGFAFCLGLVRTLFAG